MQYIKCSIPQIFPPALKMRGEMDFQDFPALKYFTGLKLSKQYFIILILNPHPANNKLEKLWSQKG